MKRGIIASASVMKSANNLVSIDRGLSPEEIRYFALYWDRIVIPGSRIVYSGVPDEDDLISSGVIERPVESGPISFVGGGDLMVKMVLEWQAKVAQDLLAAADDTEWVLHEFGRRLVLPKNELIEKRQLRFELCEALPVPSGTTPVAEILEFKHRRADELKNLHARIDEVYLEALKSPDPALSAKSAVRDLAAAVAAVEATSVEKWGKTKKYTLSTSFNLDGEKLMKNVALGAAFDFFATGMTIPLGSAFAGAASLFSIKASADYSWAPVAKENKLAYLSYAKKEGLISAAPVTAPGIPPRASGSPGWFGLRFPLRFNSRVGRKSGEQ